MKDTDRMRMPRRAALKTIGLAGAAALAAPATGFAQAPAVRRKVSLSYWTWSDNPGHQKMLNDVVDSFNKSQEFTTVQLDAGSRTMEVRQKLLVAYAAGAAPDIAGVVQTNVQEYFDTGVMSPVEPYFSKWDQKDDYFPNVVEFMHSKPGQPVLYMPARILPYVLFYRADWFDEAKLAPPKTYDEFIEAARPPDQAGRTRGRCHPRSGLLRRAADRADLGQRRCAVRRRQGQCRLRLPRGHRGHGEIRRHVHQGQVYPAHRGE